MIALPFGFSDLIGGEGMLATIISTALIAGC